MKKEQIVNEMTDLVKGILNHSDFVLSDNMTAGEIRGWDSLTHMEIIAAIEKHFGVKFTFAEILKLTNMGDMFSLLETKLS